MPAAQPRSRVALVTGSSRGIGLAIAVALGRTGHRLVLVARDQDRLAAAVAAIAPHTEALAMPTDLREPAAATRVVAAARAAFGDVDVLVNNAGTAPTAKVEATTDAMLAEVLDLHVAAPLRLLRELLPAMRQRGQGCVVQLASTAGLRGFPFTAAYTAAKHGMVGLARALHAELRGSGIDVFALCPGFVDTDITRQAAAAVAARGRMTAAAAFERMAAQNRIGRMHTADEVAAAVAMLVQQRPRGCVYDLDRIPPAFVDDEEPPTP